MWTSPQSKRKLEIFLDSFSDIPNLICEKIILALLSKNIQNLPTSHLHLATTVVKTNTITPSLFGITIVIVPRSPPLSPLDGFSTEHPLRSCNLSMPNPTKAPHVSLGLTCPRRSRCPVRGPAPHSSPLGSLLLMPAHPALAVPLPPQMVFSF